MPCLLASEAANGFSEVLNILLYFFHAAFPGFTDVYRTGMSHKTRWILCSAKRIIKELIFQSSLWLCSSPLPQDPLTDSHPSEELSLERKFHLWLLFKIFCYDNGCYSRVSHRGSSYYVKWTLTELTRIFLSSLLPHLWPFRLQNSTMQTHPQWDHY